MNNALSDFNELSNNDNVTVGKTKVRSVPNKTSKRNKAKKLINKHLKTSENGMNEASTTDISKPNFDSEKSNHSNTNTKLLNLKKKRSKKSSVNEVEKEKLSRNEKPHNPLIESKERRKDKRNNSSVNINKSISTNTSEIIVKTLLENSSIIEVEKESFIDKEESFATLLRKKESISHQLKIFDNQYSMIRVCPPSIVKSLNHPPIEEIINNNNNNNSAAAVSNKTNIIHYGRNKTYRDYLLDEMQWMAIDFKQELRLKLKICKHVSNAVSCSNSKCSQHIVAQTFNKPYVSRFGLKSFESEYINDYSLDASSVALKLSNSVQKYWHDYETGIVGGSCVFDDVCQYFSSKRDLRINSKYLNKKETKSAPFPNEHSLNKEIARILSFNPILTISASLEPNNKVDPNNEKLKCKDIDFNLLNGSIKLHLHQRKVLENVLLLNKAGLGAFVFGDSYLGKTFFSCSLLQQWLVNASESESQHTVVVDYSKANKKVVLLVLSQKCLFRWISELENHQFYFPFELWNTNIDCNILNKHQTALLIVTFENLNCFLTSELFTNIISGENVDDIILKGVLVDIRCYSPFDSSKQNPQFDCVINNNSLDNISFRVKYVIKNRCLISDNGHFDEDYLPLLKFLIPLNDINEWKHLSMDSDSLEYISESKLNGRQHYYQINSNTLYQLLLNLSLQVKFSSKADSVVSAQTREEIIATAMGAVQLQMYNSVIQQLQKYPNLLDGECTSTLATSLLLLRKVCFHSYLLTSHLTSTAKDRIFHENSLYNGYNTSEQMDKIRSSNVEVFENTNIPQHLKLSQLSNVDLSQNDKSDHDDSEIKQIFQNTENESAEDVVVFGPGPLSINYRQFNNNAFLKKHSEILYHSLSPPLMESTSDSQATIVEGSCKLTCLIQLMKRFTGLRIVVTVETQEEFQIVNLLFNLLKIGHLQAGLALKHMANNCSTIAENNIDYLRKFIITQDAVRAFNAPGASSSILLATKQVFQPPSLAPQQADIVIILSESWSSYLDIKNVFRLRLLSAGPTGPPLTVVRVVASHSIEEQMARNKCSFLQFQGSLLPMITTKLFANKSAINILTDYYSATPQKRILDRAPTLVTGVVRNSLTNATFAKSLNLLDQNVLPDISSPYSVDVIEAERSDTESKTNLPHSLTMSSKYNNGYGKGKGKGLIVTSKEGNTSFVKDQKTMLELGLVSARSSIINAINSLNLLRNNNTEKWLVQLQLDMVAKEHNFNGNYEIVKMSMLNNTWHLSKTLERKFVRSNNHYVLINSQFLNVDNIPPIDTVTAMEYENQKYNEKHSSHIRKPMDSKAIETSKHNNADMKYIQSYHTNDSIKKNKLIPNQSVLIDVYQLLVEELNRRMIYSLKGMRFGLHLYFIKSIVNKWQFEIEKLDDFVSLSKARQYNANLSSDIKSELSVLGKSIADIKVSKLIFPNAYLYSSSNLQQENQKLKVESYDSYQYWPKSYMIYRQVGYEYRKSGKIINNFVFVNPLQVASRTDFINVENYHNNANVNQSNIMIKYVSSLQRTIKPQRKRVINHYKNNLTVLNEKNEEDNNEIRTMQIKSSIDDHDFNEVIHPRKKQCINLGDLNNIESESI